MSLTKSVLESIELQTGTQIYVQLNSYNAALSIDGKEVSYSLSLTIGELEQLTSTIEKALQVYHEN